MAGIPQALGTLFQGYLQGRQYAEDNANKLKSEERNNLHQRANMLVTLMDKAEAPEHKAGLQKMMLETMDAIEADGKRGSKSKPNGIGGMFKSLLGIQPAPEPQQAMPSVAAMMADAEQQRQARARSGGAQANVAGTARVPQRTPRVTEQFIEGPSSAGPGRGDDGALNLGPAVDEAIPTRPTMQPPRSSALDYLSQQPQTGTPARMRTPGYPDMVAAVPPQKARIEMPSEFQKPSARGVHDHNQEMADIENRNTVGGFPDERAIKAESGAVADAHKNESELFGQQKDEWLDSIVRRASEFISTRPGAERSFSGLMAKYPEFAHLMNEVAVEDPKRFEAFRSGGMFSDYAGTGYQKPPSADEQLTNEIVTAGRDAGQTPLQIKSSIATAGSTPEQQAFQEYYDQNKAKGIPTDQIMLQWKANNSVKDSAALQTQAGTPGMSLADAVGKVENAGRVQSPGEQAFDGYLKQFGGDVVKAYEAFRRADNAPGTVDTSKTLKNQLLDLKVKEYGSTAAGLSRAIREVESLGDRPRLTLKDARDPVTGETVYAYFNDDNPTAPPIYTKTLTPGQGRLDQWMDTMTFSEPAVDPKTNEPLGFVNMRTGKGFNAVKILDGINRGLIHDPASINLMADEIERKQNDKESADKLRAAVAAKLSAW